MSKSNRNKISGLTDESTIGELKDLSPSALNSFLLDLFDERVSSRKPSELLEQFRNSRFVTPSDIDPISIRKTELDWLQVSSKDGFKTVILSPLAPLGTSSSVAHVHQNNVVSALRGTEVVSDATNVLALQIAMDLWQNPDNEFIHRYSTVHRHVRGQAFDNPKFSAHFSTFCLASGGLDSGNYTFELNELDKHLSLTYEILLKYFKPKELALKFYLKKNSDFFSSKLNEKERAHIWQDHEAEIIDDPDHDYYQLIQFKVFVKKGEEDINIADGGFVDWTQKLLNNQKHRCMISGIGIELLHRIIST